MHALHLPPRHLWRVTLLAALLALAVMALLPAATDRMSSDGVSSSTSVTAAPALTEWPATTGGRETARPPLAPVPDWLADPVRPPSLGAP